MWCDLWGRWGHAPGDQSGACADLVGRRGRGTPRPSGRHGIDPWPCRGGIRRAGEGQEQMPTGSSCGPSDSCGKIRRQGQFQRAGRVSATAVLADRAPDAFGGRAQGHCAAPGAANWDAVDGRHWDAVDGRPGMTHPDLQCREAVADLVHVLSCVHVTAACAGGHRALMTVGQFVHRLPDLIQMVTERLRQVSLHRGGPECHTHRADRLGGCRRSRPCRNIRNAAGDRRRSRYRAA
jgi:hypothetical protein